MIFSIWYLLWVFSATAAMSFAIPIVGLFIRNAYLNTEIAFLTKYHVAVAMFVFVGFALTRGNSVEDAVVLALQVVAMMGLAFHLSKRIIEVPFSRMPRSLATIAFVSVRYFKVISEKRKEFEYSVAVRCSMGGVGFWRRMRMRSHFALKGVFAALTDFVVFIGQLETILEARGGLPHPKMWMEPGYRKSDAFSLATVDVVLLIVFVALPVLATSGGWIPWDVRGKIGEVVATLGLVGFRIAG